MLNKNPSPEAAGYAVTTRVLAVSRQKLANGARWTISMRVPHGSVIGNRAAGGRFADRLIQLDAFRLNFLHEAGVILHVENRRTGLALRR